MEDFPILVINLDRSLNRMRNMLFRFGSGLTRIEGVDGWKWQDFDHADAHGRPLFKADSREMLCQLGILGDEILYPLVPSEVGCALGHRAAWRYIVQNELAFAVVLEDDVRPTSAFLGSFMESIDAQGGMPTDADVLFLHGKDSDIVPMKGTSEGRLLYGCGNYGYVITARGARRAIDAQFPMYLPCDMQWWAEAFKGFELSLNLPGPVREKGYAYVQDRGIVDMAEDGYSSTMTCNGKKPWKILP